MREERGLTPAQGRVCGCEVHKKGRGEPHKIVPGLVHSYSDQPSDGWQPLMSPSEKGTPGRKYYLGVELETMLPEIPPMPADLVGLQPDRDLLLAGRTPPVLREYEPEPRTNGDFAVDYYSTEYRAWERQYIEDSAYNTSATRDYELPWRIALDEWQSRRWRMQNEWYAQRGSDVTSEDAVGMARPAGLWLPKHDGSVTGPEFASQPATLSYWRWRLPDVTEMFTMLLHAGLRSFEGDKCGMHINISTTAFTKLDGGRHLFRFATLLNSNKDWTRRMSQRTLRSAQQWASVAAFDDVAWRERWSKQISRNGYASQDRYCMLNAGNDGRIEFRLPRGTLRVDRFYKNLEWTVAMIEYTRDEANDGLNSAAFMRWSIHHKHEYPYLTAFLQEKFGAMLTTPVQTRELVTA